MSQAAPFDVKRDSLHDLLDHLGERLAVSREEQRRNELLHAPSFSALAYLENNETKQTEIIASLLNPKGKHGQGSLFLRHFLRAAWELTTDEDWPEECLQRAKIYLEHYIDSARRPGRASRRIDLWIEIDERRLAVESKAKGAPDQLGQVNDYLMYMKKTDRAGVRSKLMYLSPDGKEPSYESIKTEDWNNAVLCGTASCCDYSIFIQKWLGESKRRCKSRKIQFFIDDLMAFIGSSEEGMAITHAIDPNILSLLKAGTTDGRSLARRDALFSICESANLIFEDVLANFEDELRTCLTEFGMRPELAYGGLRNATFAPKWGEVRVLGKPGLPYVAVQRCRPERSHNVNTEHLILGLNLPEAVDGSKDKSFPMWRKRIAEVRLPEGTNDGNWLWQEVLEGCEDLESRVTAIKLLETGTAIEVATKMRDRLKSLEAAIEAEGWV